MHSSGSITRKFGPSWKQSTGHTSTQSVYLHLMQVSVTTKVMRVPAEAFSERRIVPQLRRRGRSRDGVEVELLAPGRAVGEIALQAELDAPEGELVPRHVALLAQHGLEALRPDAECG